MKDTLITSSLLIGAVLVLRALLAGSSAAGCNTACGWWFWCAFLCR